jgi:hypothetical protein
VVSFGIITGLEPIYCLCFSRGFLALLQGRERRAEALPTAGRFQNTKKW